MYNWLTNLTPIYSSSKSSCMYDKPGFRLVNCRLVVGSRLVFCAVMSESVIQKNNKKQLLPALILKCYVADEPS